MKNTKGKHSGSNKITRTSDKKNKRAFLNNDININPSNTNSANARQKTSRKNTKKKSTLLTKILIIICLIAIIISLFNIICWFIENNNSNKMLNSIQSKTQVTTENITVDGENVQKFKYDFTELLKENPNTKGWINVTNTNINYPIVQAKDNDYYLNHSFDNSSNSAGWVFADANCDTNDFQNLIIYGHNRKDRSMFGSLKDVLNDDWQADSGNYYINFSNINESHVYRIFSCFVCNDSDVSSYLNISFKNQKEFENYVLKMKQHSNFNFNTNIENPQQILTLYTCYGLNNQRLLVFAVRVD